MKNQSRIIASVLLTAIFTALLTACSPMSKGKIEKTLRQSIKIDFEYIGKEIVPKKEVNRSYTDKLVYKYRDENGVEFSVETAFGGTGEYSVGQWAYCNYLEAQMEIYEPLIESIILERLPDAPVLYFGYTDVYFGIDDESQIDIAGEILYEISRQVPEFNATGGGMVYGRPLVRLNWRKDPEKFYFTDRELCTIIFSERDLDMTPEDYSAKIREKFAEEVEKGFITP